MKYFFVSQRQTHKEEHSQSYLWAPRDGVWHHETMSEVKKGDAIIQYTGKIVGVGIALKDNYNFDRPDANGFSKWDKQGYKVDVEQFHFVTSIEKESVKNALLESQPKYHAPLNVNGGVNQGYLFPANVAMVNIILRKALEIDQSPQQVEVVKKIQEKLNIDLSKKNENEPNQGQDAMNKSVSIQKIFFGAPGTGKSFKVNSILPNEDIWSVSGEIRKQLFLDSDTAKKAHYAEVLDNKEKFGDIWNVGELSVLEEKLSEVNSVNNVSNPEHSALQAYIKFLKEYKFERVFRTTFHPDYDYAQFVGAYKPKKVQCSDDGSLSEEQLAKKLSEFFSDNEESDKTSAIVLFGLRYANSLNGKTISEIVKHSGIGEEQYKKANLSAAVKAQLQFSKDDGTITYSFVPQVFAKAYATAWKQYFAAGKASTADNQVYLVIEEINRGNCAQIFGDIFQLLDRDSEGFSQYSIDADCDFAEWLKDNGVGDGKLKLPPNLNILATMNTSDQSLFPMDSAFKRRFDWEYVPINYKMPKADFKVGEGDLNFDWLHFLKKVNADIRTVTESEDKQMGEFFIKPKDNDPITLEEFRSKVLFYLWDTVYKDEIDKKNLFHIPYPEKGPSITFQRLFEEDEAGKISDNSKKIIRKMLETLDAAYDSEEYKDFKIFPIPSETN